MLLSCEKKDRCALHRDASRSRFDVCNFSSLRRHSTDQYAEVLNAPRPLTGDMFANPDLVYDDEGGRKVKMLSAEIAPHLAAKLGTRAAFHRTICVRSAGGGGGGYGQTVRGEGSGGDGGGGGGKWTELDVAGPALDNYTMMETGLGRGGRRDEDDDDVGGYGQPVSGGGGRREAWVPLCVNGIEEEEMQGWTEPAEDFVAAMDDKDDALAAEARGWSDIAAWICANDDDLLGAV